MGASRRTYFNARRRKGRRNSQVRAKQTRHLRWPAGRRARSAARFLSPLKIEVHGDHSPVIADDLRQMGRFATLARRQQSTTRRAGLCTRAIAQTICDASDCAWNRPSRYAPSTRNAVRCLARSSQGARRPGAPYFENRPRFSFPTILVTGAAREIQPDPRLGAGVVVRRHQSLGTLDAEPNRQKTARPSSADAKYAISRDNSFHCAPEAASAQSPGSHGALRH